MELRAILTLEVEASDICDGADQRRRLQDILLKLRLLYPDAGLKLVERRRPSRATGPASAPSKRLTGRLKRYINAERL